MRKWMDVPKDFLTYTGDTRRELLCHYIKYLDAESFDELCFQLGAPPELLDAWEEKVPMTEERRRLISRIFLRMSSPHLSVKMFERYGARNRIEKEDLPTEEEVEQLEQKMSRMTEEEIDEQVIKGTLFDD